MDTLGTRLAVVLKQQCGLQVPTSLIGQFSATITEEQLNEYGWDWMANQFVKFIGVDMYYPEVSDSDEYDTIFWEQLATQCDKFGIIR